MAQRQRTRSGSRATSVLITGLLACALALTGCNKAYQSNAQSTTTAPSPSLPTSTESSAAPRATATDAPNDLKTGHVDRTIRAGSLTLSVTYATTLPTRRWTTSATKPLSVTISATDNSSPDTKIYLSRVTCAITPSDGSGPIDSPAVLTDVANISPGYLANFPYTYEQVFTVPSVADGATAVSISFKYELLSTVPGGSKDYTKQTAVSTIQVPLA